MLLLAITAGVVGATRTAGAGAPAEVDPGFRARAEDPTRFRDFNGVVVDAEGRVTVAVMDYTPALPGPSLVRFLPDGSVDSGFRPRVAGTRVISMVCLRSGSLLVGGQCQVTGEGVTRTNLARLAPDGSLDATFDPGLGWGTVGQLVELADGRILVGAQRRGADGVWRPGPYRLEADGRVDESFAGGAAWAEITEGWIVPRPDGSFYLIGLIRPRAGGDLVRIARARPDGSPDDTFHYVGSWVYSGGPLSPDGGIYVFTQSLKSDLRTSVMDVLRLRPDGSVDPAFHAEVSGRNLVIGSDIYNAPYIYAMALQLDGRLLVAGKFDHVNGVARKNLVRVEADGTVDASFDPGSGPVLSTDGSGFGYPVKGMVLARDGRIYLGGMFDRYDGKAYRVAIRLWGDPVPRLRIKRSSGAVDVSWVGHPGESVEVETSNDLTVWSPHHAFTGGDGVTPLPPLTGDRVFVRARVK